MANDVNETFDTLLHKVGMFDEIGGRIDDAGDEDFVVGNVSFAVAENGPFMAVAGVGGFKEQLIRPHLHQRVKHLGHRDVADVRPLVISPTNMDPNAGRIDAFQCMVEGLNMRACDLEEFIVR